MKKLLTIALILIGCASAKSQSRYIMKLSLVERPTTEKQAKSVLTRIDTIVANSDTAAAYEAFKRFFIYNVTTRARYKASKDSSAIVTGVRYTLKDASGNEISFKVRERFVDSVMRDYFTHQHN